MGLPESAWRASLFSGPPAQLSFRRPISLLGIWEAVFLASTLLSYRVLMYYCPYHKVTTMKRPRPPEVDPENYQATTFDQKLWEAHRIQYVARKLKVKTKSVLRLIADEKLSAVARYQGSWHPLVASCVREALEKGQERANIVVYRSWAPDECTGIKMYDEPQPVLEETIRVLQFQLDHYKHVPERCWHSDEFSRVWIDDQQVQIKNKKLSEALRIIVSWWNDFHEDIPAQDLLEALDASNPESASLGDMFKSKIGKRIRGLYLHNAGGVWGLTELAGGRHPVLGSGKKSPKRKST